MSTVQEGIRRVNDPWAENPTPEQKAFQDGYADGIDGREMYYSGLTREAKRAYISGFAQGLKSFQDQFEQGEAEE